MRTLFSLLITGLLPLAVFGQSYFLNGDAIFLGDDCYQLTNNVGNQNGTVWYADQIDLNEPFTIEFLINLGWIDGNGADGMVFVMHQDGTNAIGVNGGGLGYEGFNTSIGIEFDTWQNTNNGDPVQDHIALVSNGSVDHTSAFGLTNPVSMLASGGNAEDGQDHIAKIKWDPAFSSIELWFDCNLRMSVQYDIINQIFGGESLVYWGFTGSTGGSSNQQTVCLEENILSVSPDVTICTGSEAELSVAGDDTNTYTWDPPTGLDDPNSQNPIASPEETTTYIVSYLDLCNDPIADSVTVTVQPLEATIDDPGLLTCEEPEAFLSVTSNFTSSLNFDWETPDGNIVIGGSSGTPLVDATGMYIVDVNYDNICMDTDTIFIDADWTFDIALTEGLEVTCFEPTVEISTDVTNANASYVWSSSDGTIASGIFNPQINAASGGTYEVTVTINDFCIDTESVEVIGNNTPYTLSIDPASQIDCDTPETILSVDTNGGGGQITWSTTGNFVSGSDGLAPVIDAGGDYTLSLFNPDNGCTTEETIVVDEDFAVPAIDAGLTDTLTCRVPQIMLQGDGLMTNASYLWTSQEGNIVNGQFTLSPTVDEPGMYYFEITDDTNGCSNQDSVAVVVTEDFFLDLSALALPNVFTPNNDLLNPFFKPFLRGDETFNLVEVMPVYELQIFNRWGNLVWQADRLNEPFWDGQIDGNDAAPGTYYAVFTYAVDCGADQSGDLGSYFQIIR